MEIVNFSAESHQGPFLNVNEDGFEFDLDNNIYMVFDGYGGNNIGDRSVKELQKNISKFYQNFIVDRDSTLPFYFSPKYLMEGNALINAALFSHHHLYKENLTKDVSKRAGASSILAVKSESVLTLLSTGNCRAYLLRRGQIKSIFTEDSFHYLTRDKYDSHLKNVPLSGFGLFPDLHYQVRELRVTKNDKIILLTDGVYGRLDDEEIESSVSKNTLNIKVKIQELFELSNNRGNLDNQTCMILEF